LILKITFQDRLARELQLCQQTLKPYEFATFFGTTEVVPFQNRFMRPLLGSGLA
jgi:hypothetical protein